MTIGQWSAAVMRLVALLALAAAAAAAAPATAPPLMSVATPRLPYGRFVPASPSLLDAAAAAKRGVLPRPVSAFGSSPSASTLKVFGIGLQRTGTTSLSNALTKMGLSVIHWDQDCTVAFPHSSPFTFSGLYDDIDAVLDLPTAFFPAELLAAYPTAKFISTERDVDEWFTSISGLTDSIRYPGGIASTSLSIVARINAMAYGSALPDRAVWSSHYLAHYEKLVAAIPPAQLLRVHMDEVRKESPYPRICAFLGLEVAQCPTGAYPRTNALKDRRKPRPSTEAPATPVNAPYAYATLLAHASPAAVLEVRRWCRRIRSAYDSSPSPTNKLPYDVVLLELQPLNLTQTQVAALSACFDDLLPIGSVGSPARGTADTPEDRALRAKLNVVALEQYRRVVYLDPDQLLSRPMEFAMFREEKKNNATEAPPAFLTLSSIDGSDGESAPLRNVAFSVAPSLASLTDAAQLLTLGLCTPQTGWMEYGQWKVPQLQQPHAVVASSAAAAAAVKPRDWNFRGACGLAGFQIFYFFLLNPQMGALIDPKEYARSVVTASPADAVRPARRARRLVEPCEGERSSVAVRLFRWLRRPGVHG